MPSLNVQALINHLEVIDKNLEAIWNECMNLEILQALEQERNHLYKIIGTLKNLVLE